MINKELFTKNNFDTQLEEVIENKAYSDESKSLILNILYKIEIAYKDYANVKPNVKSKNDIILEIIENLENRCDAIEITNPKESKKCMKVEKKNKKIISFPNEAMLLQAIYYISTIKSSNFEDSFIDATVQEIFNKGRAIDGAEIIRDFNGWSWNNLIERNSDKIYNLVYQNMLMLLEKEELKEVMSKEETLNQLYLKLSEKYGEKKTTRLIEAIKQACVMIFVKTNKNGIELLKKYKSLQMQNLDELKNKSSYIENMIQENDSNMEIVNKLSKVINSKDLLEKNYSRANIKEKYVTIDDYLQMLKIKRKEKLEIISENSLKVNPFEYAKQKAKYENEIILLEKIEKKYQKKEALLENIILLQRAVINCYYKKIEIYDLKKEQMSLVNEIRYYNSLPVINSVRIKDLKNLEVDRRNLQKKIINKLCENKVMDTFSKDYNINYQILNYVFIAKTINLIKILLQMKYENSILKIEYYDEKAIENTVEYRFSDDDLQELSRKLEKKLRIFI